MKSSAAAAGSFAPTLQFAKLEIHTVFLHFANFNLEQNLSPSALADYHHRFRKEKVKCLNSCF